MNAKRDKALALDQGESNEFFFEIERPEGEDAGSYVRVDHSEEAKRPISMQTHSEYSKDVAFT